MNTLKSEFRKLLTVRSTYWMTAIAVVLLSLLAGYGEGYKNAAQLHAYTFSNSLLNLASTVVVFAVVVAILLMAHEYRYNTITYTLVNSNSRTKVLLSKIFVVLSYSIALTALVVFAVFGSIALGAQLAGTPLPHQEINYGLFLLKSCFFVAATALAGLLFAVLIRNLVAAIAAYFILPNIIELVGNLILKENSVYLPFTALNEVIITVPPDTMGLPFTFGNLSPLEGALIFLAYLIPGWLIAWYLFLRRDAL